MERLVTHFLEGRSIRPADAVNNGIVFFRLVPRYHSWIPAFSQREVGAESNSVRQAEFAVRSHLGLTILIS